MTRRDLFISTAALAAGGGARTAAGVTAITLPKLPYATDALEPFIDAQTMEIHHGRHHKTYVDNLNKALSAYPDLARKPVVDLLKDLASVPEAVRTAVRNNGGGHVNHSLFWAVLGASKPGAGPKGRLEVAIRATFGSQAAFEEKLRAAAVSVFGSGWAWVVPEPNAGLKIETSPNQDSPWLTGRAPLLAVDVWEHAYYLKYQNRRADYLAALTKVINWEFLSQRYQDMVTKGRTLFSQ
jgi:superoxide dismutase, Fe-Mn family